MGHRTHQLIGGVRQTLRVTAANKPAAVRCCSCDVSLAIRSPDKRKRESTIEKGVKL